MGKLRRRTISWVSPGGVGPSRRRTECRTAAVRLAAEAGGTWGRNGPVTPPPVAMAAAPSAASTTADRPRRAQEKREHRRVGKGDKHREGHRDAADAQVTLWAADAISPTHEVWLGIPAQLRTNWNWSSRTRSESSALPTRTPSKLNKTSSAGGKRQERTVRPSGNHRSRNAQINTVFYRRPPRGAGRRAIRGAGWRGLARCGASGR